MKQWFTAAEIASLQLPELPATKSGVIRRAANANWPSRERAASGGGREYPLSALPVAARAAYVGRNIRVLGVPETVGLPAPVDVQPAPQPVARAAEHRNARLILLAAADRAAEEARLGRKRADHVFATGYNLDQVAVEPWIREAVPSLTPRTLARWRAAREAGATHRLAVDKGAARRGKGLLETANNGAVKTFCLALLVKNPFFSADQIRRMVGGEFGGELSAPGGELLPVPSLRTFQDALNSWKDEYKVPLTQMTDPDGYRSKYKVSGRNSLSHITRVNQLWMLDASPLDMLCVDGRYSVYVAVDVFSRRMMVYLSRTPRASAVGLLMRRALLAWGVPHEVKTDNGSDFVAKATKGLFASIRLDHVTCRPFEPNEKPHVESAIKTFQHGFVPLLDGYIGHSVADRKKIEGRRAFSARLGTDDRQLLEVKLTAADVQTKADEWIRLVYEHRPHEGLARRTVFQVASASSDAIRMVDANALDVLLAPLAGRNGLRVVSKYGLLINHAYYHVPAHVQPGDQVLVRMDPMNLGRVLVFDPTGAEYLGDANCPALDGTDPKAAVAAKKRAQAEHIAVQTAPIRKEARRIGRGTAVVDLVLRDAARRAGTLVDLPKRTVAHTTPQLDAAAQAVAPVQAPSVSDEARALRAQLAADMAAVVPLRTEETPRQRYNRACALEQRLARGETLTADETRFLVGYVRDPEYRAFRETFGDPVGTVGTATAG
ncbi:DDE-type integrase/transposase/recombinase [Aquabacter cavernae]|uniref:DDE-type integrase/transposase/recombinase n=1 Tax=Aquabacter cavernae TaxID=2496029 RepID=UPI0013E08C11|nr:DDE-type integrase/transposase/recombinase [Aquabacter cavernae]